MILFCDNSILIRKKMNDIIKKIVLFLSKDGEYSISKEENLFENGFLDSMGVLEIISLIEEMSGKDFNPELFIMENFQTINAIEEFLNKELHD